MIGSAHLNEDFSSDTLRSHFNKTGRMVELRVVKASTVPLVLAEIDFNDSILEITWK